MCVVLIIGFVGNCWFLLLRIIEKEFYILFILFVVDKDYRLYRFIWKGYCKGFCEIKKWLIDILLLFV